MSSTKLNSRWSVKTIDISDIPGNKYAIRIDIYVLDVENGFIGEDDEALLGYEHLVSDIKVTPTNVLETVKLYKRWKFTHVIVHK